MYWRRPTAAELGDIGTVPEDFPELVADVWSENWSGIQLFSRLSTQWRVGMDGPVGLDYNVFFHELDRQGLPADDYDQMIDTIRIIESAALEQFKK